MYFFNFSIIFAVGPAKGGWGVCEMSKIIHSEVSLMVAVWYGRYFTTSPDFSALWISAISCTKKSMVAEGAQFFV